ncbi:MAG TPA: hypothetical protein PKD79_01035 [Candidatus Doudnabacteria bacterium]|nr:hypothetical protein [Candidatus Doudnabacteria bacterium]
MVQTAIAEILETESEVLKVILEVYGIGHSPMRRDLNSYYYELVMDHRKNVVRQRLKQNREDEVKQIRKLGAVRVHFSGEEISEAKVENRARVAIQLEAERIKFWQAQGLDPVQELYKFLEK